MLFFLFLDMSINELIKILDSFRMNEIILFVFGMITVFTIRKKKQS